jgi:hypothetical protein
MAKTKVDYTGMTRRWLEAQGYLVGKTEYWNSFTCRRHDLWGWCDMLAIKPNEITAVQSTSYSNIAARRNKIKSLDSHKTWLQAGGFILIIGWRKIKNRWTAVTDMVWPEEITNGTTNGTT